MRKTSEWNFNELFTQFIKDSFSGKRCQPSGRSIKKESVNNYLNIFKLLVDFQLKNDIELRIRSITRLNSRELNREKNYWSGFYRNFTEYLYKELNHYDNYVGTSMKLIRVFFNYLNNEKQYNIGNYHKLFYVQKEEIQIVILLPEQLNFLIYNKEFESSLNAKLQLTKDIFVFGCTVALRVSDLMNCKWINVEQLKKEYYIKMISQKTQTNTRIKLPDYAVEILLKHKSRRNNIFPKTSINHLNNNIKKLIELAGWTHTVPKTRTKKGVPSLIFKDKIKKEHYRFCDHITSHTMRRTGITTLLSLGMPEHMVRKISGHAPNSKEFYRYVELSQQYLDQETDKAFNRLSKKKYMTR